MAKKINVKVESVKVNEEDVMSVVEEVNTEDTKKNKPTTDPQIEFKVRVFVKDPQKNDVDVCDYIVKAFNESDAVYKMSLDYLMKKGFDCEYIRWSRRSDNHNLMAECYCQTGIVITFFVPSEIKTEEWSFSEECIIKDRILFNEVRRSSSLTRLDKIKSEITTEFIKLPIEEATREKAREIKMEKLCYLVDSDFYCNPLPSVDYYQLFSFAASKNKNNLPVNPNRTNGFVFIIDEGEDKCEGRYFTAACIRNLMFTVVRIYKNGKIEEIRNISNYIKALFDKFVSEYSEYKNSNGRKERVPYEVCGIGEVDGLRVVKINILNNFTWNVCNCSIFENGHYVIEKT